MKPSITIGDRRVGSDHATYVIAEAGSNHDGDFGQATKLIEVAAASGADAVKFQLFEARHLYPENCGVVELADGAQDFYELISDLEMPREWVPKLGDIGRRCGIDVLYTPFDTAAVDLLIENESPALKVASPELSHLPLLRHIGRTGQPTILSTGMSTLADIDESSAQLRRSGCRDLAVLHCVTAYPCPPEFSNLDTIAVLEAAFGAPAGLSDHTLDPVAAPMVAVAVGASIIEKHFTLSRTLDGPDHGYAIEPDELHDLVASIRSLDALDQHNRLAAATDRLGAEQVGVLRGSAHKTVVSAEAELAACDRRSLHAIADIAPGERLTESNVAVLRGERNLRPGLHPRHWPDVEGCVAQRNIGLGQGLEWNDVVVRQP